MMLASSRNRFVTKNNLSGRHGEKGSDGPPGPIGEPGPPGKEGESYFKFFDQEKGVSGVLILLCLVGERKR